MNARDLRLGNLVWNHIQNGIVPVNTKILLEQIAADKGAFESWQPIKITVDILLKLGFKKTNNVLSDEFIVHENLFDITYSSNQMWLRTDRDVIPLTNILYIHQLQNLYFSLTGIELKIA